MLIVACLLAITGTMVVLPELYIQCISCSMHVVPCKFTTTFQHQQHSTKHDAMPATDGTSVSSLLEGIAIH
jgi:hypothetical protein